MPSCIVPVETTVGVTSVGDFNEMVLCQSALIIEYRWNALWGHIAGDEIRGRKHVCSRKCNGTIARTWRPGLLASPFKISHVTVFGQIPCIALAFRRSLFGLSIRRGGSIHKMTRVTIWRAELHLLRRSCDRVKLEI